MAGVSHRETEFESAAGSESRGFRTGVTHTLVVHDFPGSIWAWVNLSRVRKLFPLKKKILFIYF